MPAVVRAADPLPSSTVTEPKLKFGAITSGRQSWFTSPTEMVAGFSALRSAMPMNIRARRKHGELAPAVQKDIDRVKKLWTDCINVSGGPFLYGMFSIADAMYAPVVTRFRSYGVETDPTITAYMKSIEALPAMKVWAERAAAEKHRVPEYEAIAEALPAQ